MAKLVDATDLKSVDLFVPVRVRLLAPNFRLVTLSLRSSVRNDDSRCSVRLALRLTITLTSDDKGAVRVSKSRSYIAVIA